MEKTYRILDNPVPMSADEIKRTYNGSWVYVVNAELSDTRKLLRGTPVVVGSTAYAGASDGIYEKYNGDEYMPRVGRSMLRRGGFISSLRFVRPVSQGHAKVI